MANQSITIEKLWKLKGFEPNPSQKEAILHTEGPLFFTAGPGSGKTRGLLWWTLNLLVFHGVKSKKIYLSTFTEKSARQLRDGPRTLLWLVTNHTQQPYDISGMALGTIHSICQKLIADRRFSKEEDPPYGDTEAGKKKPIPLPLVTGPLDEYFPQRKEYPQCELIGGSTQSMYDQIQTDSDVERNLVDLRLKADEKKGNIICYFKFPTNFKIKIPKIIGNYNPDWGIVRIGKDGKAKIHLVRKTKGSSYPKQLRFSNEKRKKECTKKHFKVLDLSYRQVTDKMSDWMDR